MIVHPAPQNSGEWLYARAGLPTASQFDRILTPKKLTPSTQAEKYLNKLLSEWVLGEPLENMTSAFMERGSELEDEAVTWYEFMRQPLTVERVGLCLRDDKRVGASPDGLVGEGGGLEIKTPSAAVHMGYLRNPDSLTEEYRCQVQGNIWVCEREWWDMVSYNPLLPSVLVRCERDDEFIAALSAAVYAFADALDAAKKEGPLAMFNTTEASDDG